MRKKYEVEASRPICFQRKHLVILPTLDQTWFRVSIIYYCYEKLYDDLGGISGLNMSPKIQLSNSESSEKPSDKWMEELARQFFIPAAMEKVAKSDDLDLGENTPQRGN